VATGEVVNGAVVAEPAHGRSSALRGLGHQACTRELTLMPLELDWPPTGIAAPLS